MSAPAVTALLAEGISVNITLIFSLARYDAVIDAFLDGLDQARAAGRDLASIASVASFFVSRVDTETDARLDKIGTPAAAALRGRAAIAALEEHGLAAFDASWRDLGGQLAAAMRNHTQQESGK